MSFFIGLGKRMNQWQKKKNDRQNSATIGELQLIAEASSGIKICFPVLRVVLHEFRAEILPYCPNEIYLKCPYFIWKYFVIFQAT